MTEQMASGLDSEALRHAIEDLDADALIALYADDAEMRIVNKNCPPNMASLLIGKDSIAEMLRDVCGRAMTHRTENEVLGEDRIAFNEACEYPDGTKVLAAITADLRDGKIVRQVSVEVWDE